MEVRVRVRVGVRARVRVGLRSRLRLRLRIRPRLRRRLTGVVGGDDEEGVKVGDDVGEREVDQSWYKVGLGFTVRV